MNIASEGQFDRLPELDRRAATEFVDKLRQRFDGQIVSIVLFGSRARGDAASDSDMDVLVVLSEADPATRKVVRYLAVEVWLKYGIYISTRVWSDEHWREAEEIQTLLYRNIRRDGIYL
jgi:predicted nucleotidyltransferase